jgi:hypothetical protein
MNDLMRCPIPLSMGWCGVYRRWGEGKLYIDGKMRRE